MLPQTMHICHNALGLQAGKFEPEHKEMVSVYFSDIVGKQQNVIYKHFSTQQITIKCLRLLLQ